MIKIELTEKEKKLVLEFIKMELDSYRQTPKKKEFDFECNFSEDMFDKDLMKSIYVKLTSKKKI